MCIAFILWQCHPQYRFFLALNRDEVHSRPTLPVHWWPANDGILAGKDLLQGGTWFGCTKSGRIALVTTFRENVDKAGLISRGHLITSFLKSTKAPLEYAQMVFDAGNEYSGFNLIVADLYTESMVYVSNRPKDNPVQPQVVMPGFHVLSNASLNSPWPKMIRGRAKMDSLVKDNLSYDELKERVLKEVLSDSVKADITALPKTGYGVDWELVLSSIFVNYVGKEGSYGTRSMVVFTVDNEGYVKFFERYLENESWKEHEFHFHHHKTSTGETPLSEPCIMTLGNCQRILKEGL
ncbi:hypothetical protein L7F22_005099 [Adiantum nelumboides]|nr:hypothetical protein [Adiantum nelumboides]